MSGVSIGKDAAENTIIAGNENKVEVHHHHYPQQSSAPSSQKSEQDSPKVDLSSLPTTSPDLFGRSREIEMLDRCWDSPKTNIVVLVAWGGVGKTSLVNHWLASMAQNDFRGADRVFGWSFYSQGAAEGKQASADRFVADALRWFGDPDPNQGDFADKAKRLSALIKQHRTLLILDGLEPLQAPPGPEEGRLKDQSLRILLRDLAVGQKGLCVITTRLWTDDLSTWRGKGVERTDLSHLAPEDGANLLKHLGVDGKKEELLLSSAEFDGHALALTLLGTYLVAAYDGDVRQRDKIDCLMYEDMPQGKHARCVMESYEAWMLTTEKGRRELNILRMMGLFDRPAESGAIKALRAEPEISGLTEEIQGVSDVQWRFALDSLRKLRLILEKDKNHPDSLDSHPLIREHFGEKLRSENPAAWKEAHSRLYEFYKNLPKKEYPDTLEEMEPLFAAVAHGCQSGKYYEALHEVFIKRINRGSSYNVYKLGAFGIELATLSYFFDNKWLVVVPNLSNDDKSLILNWTGFRLSQMYQKKEAIEVTQAALQLNISIEDWWGAARNCANLCGFYLTIGIIDSAINYAKQSVNFASLTNDNHIKILTVCYLADSLHCSGKFAEARSLYHQAESIQKETEHDFPYLYSYSGNLYNSFLFEQGEYKEIIRRVDRSEEKMFSQYLGFIDISLDQLYKGLAYSFQTSKDDIIASSYLNQSIEGLRKSGQKNNLLKGLLGRSLFYRVQKNFQMAHANLDEAFEIADRSGMRLYLTDYHLESSRLCLAEGNKIKAKEHLASARKLIAETGYHRRDKEAEELERCLNQDSQD